MSYIPALVFDSFCITEVWIDDADSNESEKKLFHGKMCYVLVQVTKRWGRGQHIARSFRRTWVHWYHPEPPHYSDLPARITLQILRGVAVVVKDTSSWLSESSAAWLGDWEYEVHVLNKPASSYLSPLLRDDHDRSIKNLIAASIVLDGQNDR